MPDTDLQRLYDLLFPLRNQPECLECRRCEENVGLVYLLGDESARTHRHRLPIVNTSDGVEYIERTDDGFCTAFDEKQNRCRIYDDRPLCCRIYPLDLMWLDGDMWWTIHTACPIGQRFQIERRLDILCAMTAALEAQLPAEELKRWIAQDALSSRIEAFSFEPTRVTKLRRYRTPMYFP